MGSRGGTVVRALAFHQCPGFDSRTRSHVGWVCCWFSPLLWGFFPPQKSTYLDSNSIRNLRATGLSVGDCYVLPLLNNVYLTGLKNVCACARFHGPRWRQRPGRHTKPRKNGGVFKKFRVVPGLWLKGRAMLKTVERNFYTSFLDHCSAHTFLYTGLKLVQLVKTACTYKRFMEDLGDDIRITPDFGFYLRHPIVLWCTCKAQSVGLLVY